MNANKNVYVPDVGVDLKKFTPQNGQVKQSLRREYGISEKDFILIYVAELSDRKNQMMLLKSMNKLEKIKQNIKLLLVGQGDNEMLYKNFIEKNTLKNVLLLNFRNDVDKLMQIADIAVSSSKQEGLPVNIMEAMATGLPILATNCRGNRDLVVDNKNGFTVDIGDVEDFTNKLLILYKDSQLRKEYGETSLIMVKDYSTENINMITRNIYNIF